MSLKALLYDGLKARSRALGCSTHLVNRVISMWNAENEDEPTSPSLDRAYKLTKPDVR